MCCECMSGHMLEECRIDVRDYERRAVRSLHSWTGDTGDMPQDSFDAALHAAGFLTLNQPIFTINGVS
jgi:hypothetical protein